jgi:hypothetical protein
MIHLTPFFIEQAQLRGIRNMKASTYPAEPIIPTDLHTKALIVPIPQKLWQGDWVIDLEDDIKFLEHHFDAQPGELLWIREKHRFNQLEDKVEVEYNDCTKRIPLLKIYPKFTDRWMPPMGMPRRACRFILEVKEIEARWADEKRTNLVWVVGVSRKDNVDEIISAVERQ